MNNETIETMVETNETMVETVEKTTKKVKPATKVFGMAEMTVTQDNLRRDLFAMYRAYINTIDVKAVGKEDKDKPIVTLTCSAYGYGVKVASRWDNFPTLDAKGETATMLCELSGGHLRPIRPLADREMNAQAKQLRLDATNELVMVDYMTAAHSAKSFSQFMAKSPYANWAKQYRMNMTTTQVEIVAKDGTKSNKFTDEQLAANKVRLDAFNLRVEAKVLELMAETDDSE